MWNDYIDVISTASMDVYPNNTSSNFTNLLPSAQDLPENTYVALTEFSYTNCFYNIESSSTRLTIWDKTVLQPPHTPHRNPTDRPLYGEFYAVPIKAGYYPSMSAICSMINQAIRDVGVEAFAGKNVFSYDETSLKVAYDMSDIDATLFIKGPLLNLMGVEKRKAEDNELVILGKAKEGLYYEVEVEVDVEEGGKETGETEEGKEEGKGKETRKEKRYYIKPSHEWPESRNQKDTFTHVAQLTTQSTMLVYASIITSQISGDSHTDILRWIPMAPIKGEQGLGAQVVYECQEPHFLRVRQRYIKEINIQVKSLQDSFISFLVGCTRVKLLFRQFPPLPRS